MGDYRKSQGGNIILGRNQGINDIFALKSITVYSFSDCQKHEDNTVSSLSLSYIWRNGLSLYNRMILAIIMFIYSGIVVIIVMLHFTFLQEIMLKLGFIYNMTVL